MNLELEARKAAEAAGITTYTWNHYTQRLDQLKRHHRGMWEHSIRVGLYAYGIAVSEGWADTALPLMGGCGHDLGKVRIPCSVLNTTSPLTEAEWALMRRHPEDSRDMWMPEFPLTAMVAGLHHYFTPRAYGVGLDEAPEWLPARLAHKAIEATMVVMIADVFDAMTTRRNSQTRADPDDIEAIRVQLGEEFGDWPSRVEWLGNHRY